MHAFVMTPRFCVQPLGSTVAETDMQQQSVGVPLFIFRP
jgi:hypothetical protein